MGAFGFATLLAISARLRRTRGAKLKALVAALGLPRLIYDKTAGRTGYLPQARLDNSHLAKPSLASPDIDRM